jgi:hypothetical protein
MTGNRNNRTVREIGLRVAQEIKPAPDQRILKEIREPRSHGRNFIRVNKTLNVAGYSRWRF